MSDSPVFVVPLACGRPMASIFNNRLQIRKISFDFFRRNLFENLILREAIPFCMQNRYRKIRRTEQKVIYCYTGQLVSTQLWGHHQASD
jgi:hypothetical protein